MPHVPYLPRATRFFARIAKFEMECPACGKIILSNFDTRDTPLKLQTIASSARRQALKHPPKRDQSIRFLVWNPYTQRLRCPFCQKVFTLGLLAYDHEHNRGCASEYLPPEDALPTRRQRLELRLAAGGWWSEGVYRAGDEVNLVVDNPCSCPRLGWAAECPIHGDPEQRPGRTARAAARAEADLLQEGKK